MINNYDIFKDETLNCYQIRTKSNSYMVEFDDQEMEDIFLSIVDLIRENKNISYAKLKKTVFGNDSKVTDVLYLLNEYLLLPDNIAFELESKPSSNRSFLSGNKKPLDAITVSLFGDVFLIKTIKDLLLKESFLKVNTYKLNTDFNIEKIIVESDIIIVDSSKWSPSDIEQINQYALKHHKPWLYIGGIEEMSLKIGPLFYGDNTGCYNCLISRILSNHEHPEFLISYQNYLRENNKSSRKDIIPEEQLHLNILANYAVLEIKKFLLEWALPTTWRTIIKIEIRNFQISKHKLLKKPYCEICNPKLEYNPSPWLEAITLK